MIIIEQDNEFKLWQFWERPLYEISEYAFNSPVHNTSAPAQLRLPVPHVLIKPPKSSLSLHAKILFYIWNERIRYCTQVALWSKLICVTCKLLMFV